MKSIKIWSLIAMMFIAAVGCDKPEEGVGGNADGGVVGEWVLVSWCESAPEFNVYIDFKFDGTFEMYQQVYTLTYELCTGVYTLSGNKLTGCYDDGAPWQCDYTVTTGKDAAGVATITLKSQKDGNDVSVYAQTTIPEAVKTEATETRTVAAERFL